MDLGLVTQCSGVFVDWFLFGGFVLLSCLCVVLARQCWIAARLPFSFPASQLNRWVCRNCGLSNGCLCDFSRRIAEMRGQWAHLTEAQRVRRHRARGLIVVSYYCSVNKRTVCIKESCVWVLLSLFHDKMQDKHQISCGADWHSSALAWMKECGVTRLI